MSIERTPTNDQIAAVLLRTGNPTDEQKERLDEYLGRAHDDNAQGVSNLTQNGLIPRGLEEWDEHTGIFVTWWCWRDGEWLGEPAWIGSPLCEDWPGYHTHWTPHPHLPAPPVGDAQEAGR